MRFYSAAFLRIFLLHFYFLIHMYFTSTFLINLWGLLWWMCIHGKFKCWSLFVFFRNKIVNSMFSYEGDVPLLPHAPAHKQTSLSIEHWRSGKWCTVSGIGIHNAPQQQSFNTKNIRLNIFYWIQSNYEYQFFVL